MSSPKAAHREILQPSGLVHRARPGALCANVIVVDAIFFEQEASACALEGAHRKCYCHVFCSSESLSRHRV